MKLTSHINYLLSTMIASNFRLWLVFFKVLAKSGAPVKRLSTNWAKVFGFSCEKMKSHVINLVRSPFFNIICYISEVKILPRLENTETVILQKPGKKNWIFYVLLKLQHDQDTQHTVIVFCHWYKYFAAQSWVTAFETFIGEKGGKRTGALMEKRWAEW